MSDQKQAVENQDVTEPGPVLSRWWAIMDIRIGIAPLPVVVIVLALAAAYVALGKAPADILTNIAILTTGGFLCAEIGKRIPVLRSLGFAAIFATFIPSYLEYAGLLPKVLVTSISDFTESSNFLYLFIASIVVGSILGMDRRSLIQGFGKIFIPLVLGSIVAFVVGCSTGVMLGLGFEHTLFKIVAPIMAGGARRASLMTTARASMTTGPGQCSRVWARAPTR